MTIIDTLIKSIMKFIRNYYDNFYKLNNKCIPSQTSRYYGVLYLKFLNLLNIKCISNNQSIFNQFSQSNYGNNLFTNSPVLIKEYISNVEQNEIITTIETTLSTYLHQMFQYRINECNQYSKYIKQLSNIMLKSNYNITKLEDNLLEFVIFKELCTVHRWSIYHVDKFNRIIGNVIIIPINIQYNNINMETYVSNIAQQITQKINTLTHDQKIETLEDLQTINRKYPNDSQVKNHIFDYS
jgi:hypothetical protein